MQVTYCEGSDNITLPDGRYMTVEELIYEDTSFTAQQTCNQIFVPAPAPYLTNRQALHRSVHTSC